MRQSNTNFNWSFPKERFEKRGNRKYLKRSYLFNRIGEFLRTENRES